MKNWNYTSFLFFVGVIAIVLFYPYYTRAQDPQFSQFYASSLYLNPAFAGNIPQSRISAVYRNQWPSIPGAFVSYAVSYDHNLSELNSGIGFMAIHDQAGTAGLRFNNLGGYYSYAFRLNKKLMARLGLRVSYTFRNYEQSKLVYADQIIRGGATSSIENAAFRGVSYMDISSGGLVYSKKFWGGFSFDHINQPNQSLLEGEVRLPIKFSLHGGYKFLLEDEIEDEVSESITIAGIYKAQLKWDQVDIGGYYSRNQLVFGIWYRGIPFLKSYSSEHLNNDALTFLLGINVNSMWIGYSYDVTLSKLYRDTGGSHEISIHYEWPRSTKKRRRRFVVPCAKF